MGLNCQYFVCDRSQVKESSDDVTKTVPCPHKVLYLSIVRTSYWLVNVIALCQHFVAFCIQCSCRYFCTFCRN